MVETMGPLQDVNIAELFRQISIESQNPYQDPLRRSEQKTTLVGLLLSDPKCHLPAIAIGALSTAILFYWIDKTSLMGALLGGSGGGLLSELEKWANLDETYLLEEDKLKTWRGKAYQGKIETDLNHLLDAVDQLIAANGLADSADLVQTRSGEIADNLECKIGGIKLLALRIQALEQLVESQHFDIDRDQMQLLNQLKHKLEAKFHKAHADTLQEADRLVRQTKDDAQRLELNETIQELQRQPIEVY